MNVNDKNAKSITMTCVLTFDLLRKFTIKNTKENANKKK